MTKETTGHFDLDNQTASRFAHSPKNLQKLPNCVWAVKGPTQVRRRLKMRRTLTWMPASACWKCLERMSQTPEKKTDSSDYLTMLYWVACAVWKPSRDSSVGRASDRRFGGPRFDPGSRDALFLPVLIGHQHKTWFSLRDANKNIVIFWEPPIKNVLSLLRICNLEKRLDLIPPHVHLQIPCCKRPLSTPRCSTAPSTFGKTETWIEQQLGTGRTCLEIQVACGGPLLRRLHKLGERQTENAKDIDMDACHGLLKLFGRNATESTKWFRFFKIIWQCDVEWRARYGTQAAIA